jgi:hypothetical protein
MPPLKGREAWPAACRAAEFLDIFWVDIDMIAEAYRAGPAKETGHFASTSSDRFSVPLTIAGQIRRPRTRH